MVFRRDRSLSTYLKSDDDNNLRGGGTCIAVRKSTAYKVIRRSEWEYDSIEDLWVSIIPPDGKTLNINCSYIPGVTSSAIFELFFSSISDRRLLQPEDDFVLLGDLNVPEFSDSSLSRGTKFDCLSDFAELGNFTQFNKVPNSFNGGILDLVFSNTFLTVNLCDDALIAPDIYHPPLTISVNIDLGIAPDYIKVFRNWKSADWAGIELDLYSVNWNIFLPFEQPVDDLVDVFYQIIDEILNIRCPLVVKKIKPFKPKLSIETNRLLRKIRRVNSRWRRFGRPFDYELICQLKTLRDLSIASDIKIENERIELQLCSNPKRFWNFVNNKKTNGAGVAEYVTLDETIAYSKKEAANLFVSHFASVFSSQTPSPQNPPISNQHDVSWNNLKLTPEIIFSKLSLLDANKCAGPDGLPPSFFKRCANFLVDPLFIIFNASLKQGIMPTKWKEAYVIPIHKAGSLNDVKNYRPISKLSIISKILDSLVADELFERFKCIISSNQHGFFKGRSTTTNLLAYTERIQRSLLSGGQIDVIFTDFSKAFDTVSHNVLLKKLENDGVVGSMLQWFSSYLKSRKQRVQIGDSLSNPIDVTSSVPQGSHLGPMLFSIFINDIAKILNIEFICYADDLKMIVETDSVNNCSHLQKNLDNLSKFCDSHGLKLNASKCFVASFTRRTSRFICFDYKIKDHVLARKDVIKDLGVSFDSKCSFNSHVDSICNKSRRMLGFVIRNSSDFKNPNTIKTLYSALVRSNLEYASHIWHSEHHQRQINKIEAIQHRFIRFVAWKYFNDGSRHINYSLYENNLNIQSLKLRRTIGDVCFVTKAFSGRIDGSSFLHLFRLHVPARGTRHRQVFSPLSTFTVFDRLMRNFNSFCNDSDFLTESHSIELIKNLVIDHALNRI